MSEKKWASLVNISQDSIVYSEKIGTGSYGEVWSAIWNGSKVAAKRIHEEFFRREYDQEIRDHYIGELRKEWEILRDLVHPNVVRMFSVLFPLNKSPVIVMELMHCDLEHYIKKSTSTPKVKPSELLSIALGVAEGLEYLHGNRNPPIVRRDLATKNILLTADGHPKIADLGVAKVFAAGRDASATVVPGTPLYAAPETYPKLRWSEYGTTAKYGVKVDIFSFGVVLLVIIIGHEPVVFPLSPMKDGYKIPEVKRRKKDIQQMGDHRLKQLVLDCLQDWFEWFEYNSRYIIRMEITDTAGQERHFSVPPSYMRDVDGVFLVYDVSRNETFEKLPFWIDTVNRYQSKDNIQMLLVGNKVDLRQNMESEEMVPQEMH